MYYQFPGLRLRPWTSKLQAALGKINQVCQEGDGRAHSERVLGHAALCALGKEPGCCSH